MFLVKMSGSASRRLSLFLTYTLIVLALTGCSQVTGPTVTKLPVKVEPLKLTAIPDPEIFQGIITPHVQTDIAPAIPGIIKSVCVEPGDKVHAGQLLAKLDTDQLNAQKSQALSGENLAQAQGEAAASQMQNNTDIAATALRTAQSSLANAQVSGGNAVSQAQASLSIAQAQLVKAQTASASAVSLAKSAVESAKTQWEAAQSKMAAVLQMDQDNATKAKDALDTAQTILERMRQIAHSLTDPNLLAAQAGYDQAAIAAQNAQGKLQSDQADKTVAVAQSAYQQALSNLQVARQAKEVQVAEATVTQAEQAVQNARMARDSALKLAQNQVEQAQASYLATLNNPSDLVSEAQIASAQAAAQVIQVNIDKGNIYAPFAGNVVAVNAQAGQAVGPQAGFLVLSSTQPQMATIEVPATILNKIKESSKLELVVPALKKILIGEVKNIHPAPDPANEKYPVDLVVEAPPRDLVTGMRVEAHLINQNHQGILVPADSIITLPSGALAVYVVDKGVVHSKIIKTGVMSGSVYEITEGLNPGDQLVIEGQNLLSDNDKVKVVGEGGKQ
ncbi:efflux transporter, RND family, MFP subunit [Acididesulfobacillus acetoxydans]|uniref:Efflux transporter, RND family, MFP subunit n=1 Tax=Acididesulfobacillus acetoxydans TaxID=1561005 RepID=A0A8S0W4T1_9FIRM|nr:efflux RND transporter periplasmic adaptor subunit [Acididesulfobacillus acetoxydans]CAA7602598.1 efflux transporter, RND family, MFP subunit [Acididesulfobacillus acetoxydans]CEJ07255.1 RND_mfp: efflux transporter, RND family, MFP subunit [Acididesulfobacillus acetoxydans]